VTNQGQRSQGSRTRRCRLAPVPTWLGNPRHPVVRDGQARQAGRQSPKVDIHSDGSMRVTTQRDTPELASATPNGVRASFASVPQSALLAESMLASDDSPVGSAQGHGQHEVGIAPRNDHTVLGGGERTANEPRREIPP